MSKLTIFGVLREECGIELDPNIHHLISSPLRSDSNPSFRVYPIDKDGTDRGAYDFGTGKSYTPYSFIKEYHNYQSPSEVYEHIRNTYGIEYNPEYTRNNLIASMKSKINIVATSNWITNNKRIKAMELAIITYNKGDQSVINKIISHILT